MLLDDVYLVHQMTCIDCIAFIALCFKQKLFKIQYNSDLVYSKIQDRHHHHDHHLHVASEGCCITPVPWPWEMADLHNIEGMFSMSLQTWSTHLLFGRPGWRFQSRPVKRPSDRLTWVQRAQWAGTSLQVCQYGRRHHPVAYSVSESVISKRHREEVDRHIKTELYW